MTPILPSYIYYNLVHNAFTPLPMRPGRHLHIRLVNIHSENRFNSPFIPVQIKNNTILLYKCIYWNPTWCFIGDQGLQIL